jgi:biotin/methionine sulfoxide reductase
MKESHPTCTHWGNYLVETEDGKLLSIRNYAADKEPTEIGQSLLDALDPNVRVAEPMIRAGYLDNPLAADRKGRGAEPFVAVPWDTALNLAAEALQRTMSDHGPNAIYGGSYGWSSAGRFHHAQSQIHRFLGMMGGYVASVNSYSTAAAEVIVKHVLAMPVLKLVREAPSPDEIARHTRIAVFFGGAAIKNTQVNVGGIGCHNPRAQLMKLKDAGVRVINISPIRDDLLPELAAEWIACRPGTDVAIMMGMAHTLFEENLHDTQFLDRYTVGFEKFLPYLMGTSDGQPKDATWASQLSEIPAKTIREIARQLAADPSLLGISWSLQRQEYGEQTWWMFTTLGAMLGDIGLPGRGLGYGYGCVHNMGFGGRRIPNFKLGALGLELGEKSPPVNAFIPVARHADMLNNPGIQYRYDGQTLTYPDIQLIFWAGGNPFHHHQDLTVLEKAWEKPETIIVNEAFWTATARHADIVFPVTTTLERNDIGGSSYDTYLSPMRQAVNPYAQSRDDFEIFAGLAARLGFEEDFTEGRDAFEWVRHIYETTCRNAEKSDVQLPEFNDFWAGEQIDISDQLPEAEYTLEKFRRDPENYPLGTPSGKIEIFSATIDSFKDSDCIGHPCWYEHSEWLGGHRATKYPLHMISNQPRTRLHSQYDHARTSRAQKVKDRERARMNSNDAAERSLKDGDVIRVFNDRGATLAGLEISDYIREGVIELPTGAWYDPQTVGNEEMDVHGNPNTLTPDRGTSSLAQGCTAHSCLVEVEKFEEQLPAVSVFHPPEIQYSRQ